MAAHDERQGITCMRCFCVFLKAGRFADGGAFVFVGKEGSATSTDTRTRRQGEWRVSIDIVSFLLCLFFFFFFIITVLFFLYFLYFFCSASLFCFSDEVTISRNACFVL